jgi:cytoskeletal protein CcmA (bactofilin family)
MFSSNKKEASKSKTASIMPAAASHSLNSLVQGARVEGSVRSESDIRVDGAIKGKLICDAKVIIGPTGQIDGEIKCKNAVIEGKFEGLLVVEELLNVRESATINGEVSASKLIVQSGAIFNVNCTMGAAAAKKAAFAPPTPTSNDSVNKDSGNEKDKFAKPKPAGV